MSYIYLVRHAQYANPANIIPGRLLLKLSLAGIQQAKNLSSFFTDKKIDLIYCSPILRCHQTADIIAGDKIPLILDIRLAETLSACQGAQKHENWREQHYAHTSILGGETQQDVQKRMIDFWMTIKFDSDKNYLVCSHGDPLYFLYLYLIQQEINDDLTVNEPAGYQPKASIRPIKHDKGIKLVVLPIIKNERL